MIKVTKSIGFYILALVVFPYSWLREQPLALHYAWLDSFAAAHERVQELWSEDAP